MVWGTAAVSAIEWVKPIRILHDEAIVRWKAEGVSLGAEGFLRAAEENHAFNFQLWEAEDCARREDMGPEYVYRAKRAIDGFNQQRNNRMERMDTLLFEALSPSQDADCPVHSETPGMMIDRLSILSLKRYHMHLQTQREEVEASHREVCQQKLVTLNLQHAQLWTCLESLMQEVSAHHRTFRVYYQHKMYNDPTMNPQLYQTASS